MVVHAADGSALVGDGVLGTHGGGAGDNGSGAGMFVVRPNTHHWEISVRFDCDQPIVVITVQESVEA